MLDHVGIPVSDFERSKRFYEQALSPLGYELIMEPRYGAAGLGQAGFLGLPRRVGPRRPRGLRLRRPCDSGGLLRGGHRGGRDNGRLGLRPEYHPTYFGGFVLDPDGNNIEAVCHGPGKEA